MLQCENAQRQSACEAGLESFSHQPHFNRSVLDLGSSLQTKNEMHRLVQLRVCFPENGRDQEKKYD